MKEGDREEKREEKKGGREGRDQRDDATRGLLKATGAHLSGKQLFVLHPLPSPGLLDGIQCALPLLALQCQLGDTS